ncbi:MAG TPA: sugar transferase [Saprospiraceae bacterium]|nr:sugar transferase [Saprospiraceae bacterium]
MYRLLKRIFDILFSAAAILILSPLLIPIIISLKLTGEGYIFYLQERVGYKNRRFNIYKFATMLKDSPNMTGGIITLKKDPRITPMGGFLRKTKINELPQLLNVLFGDMSFVGPRPVMQKSFDQYPPDVQAVIYNVPPGITGIGSVIFRNEEEIITRVKEAGKDPWEFYKNEIYPYKGRLEKWYQTHCSFFTDLKILFLTAWAIVFPKSELHFHLFKNLPERPDDMLM